MVQRFSSPFETKSGAKRTRAQRDEGGCLWVLYVPRWHPSGASRQVIPHLLNWTLAFNRGAAFSFLADSSGWQTWLFGGLAVAVCVGLIVWLARTPRRDWRTALPVALIIGGALGNLIDRLIHGQVTDFIQLYWHAWSYPAFNVADSAITVGAVLLIAFGLFGGGHDHRAQQQ